MVTIRLSRPEDIHALHRRLRTQDAQEVLASGNESVEGGLAQSFERSTIRYTVEYDGLPVAMFGVVPDTILGNSANVWLLGSPELETKKKTFVRTSRRVVAELLRSYPVLWNLVDSRYKKTFRWLESCGAVFQVTPVRIGDHDFVPFVIKGAA